MWGCTLGDLKCLNRDGAGTEVGAGAGAGAAAGPEATTVVTVGALAEAAGVEVTVAIAGELEVEVDVDAEVDPTALGLMVKRSSNGWMGAPLWLVIEPAGIATSTVPEELNPFVRLNVTVWLSTHVRLET